MVRDLQLGAVVDNFLVSRRQNTGLLTYFTMNNTLVLAFDSWASQPNIIHCYCQPILAQCWVDGESNQEAELCCLEVPPEDRTAFSSRVSLLR